MDVEKPLTPAQQRKRDAMNKLMSETPEERAAARARSKEMIRILAQNAEFNRTGQNRVPMTGGGKRSRRKKVKTRKTTRRRKTRR